MKTNGPWILAADLGGTRTRVLLVDVVSQVEHWGTGGPGNPVRVGVTSAEAALTEALFAARVAEVAQVAAACVGMAGVSHPEAPALVLRAFQTAFRGLPLPASRMLRDDGEIAHVAAFGGGKGVLAVAGTGSIVLARGESGMVRVGGYGPLLGDEGSAYAVGLEALRRWLAGEDGRETPLRFATGLALAVGTSDVRRVPARITTGEVEIAVLAQIVSEAAALGDADAGQILADAATELAKLVAAAVRRAGLKPGAGFATAGGLAGSSPPYRAALLERVQAPPLSLVPLPPVSEPVRGALVLARAALEQESVPPEW